ncbi:MAG TPA: hypothetical protein VF170_00060, partial [Planctomycetaceae bacterium]
MSRSWGGGTSPGAGRSEGPEPPRPIIFVHIPKTAGTAFSYYLKRNCDAPEKAMKTFFGDYSIYDGVRDVPLILGHVYFREMAVRFPAASFVTWLRHPLDRVVSQYKSWHDPKKLDRRWIENTPDRAALAHIEFTQRATFEEFALSEVPAVLNNITNVQTRMLSSYDARGGPLPLPGRLLERLLPRPWRSKRQASRLLASAKENLERRFTFFGTVERFGESIELFRRTFGWTAEFEGHDAAANRSAPLDGEITDRA